MDFEFETLSSVSAADKKLRGGVEVASLRDYVEELEKKHIALSQYAKSVKEENDLKSKDQADIYYYLNKKLDDNYDTINKLEEQILREQSEREVSEKEYEKTIEQLTAKLAADEAKFKQKINDLQDNVDSLSEFVSQKSDMEKKMKELTKTIESERGSLKSRLDDMEKKCIQDKSKLQRDFDLQLEELKKRHQEEIHDKLSAKAKKTALLNTLYKKELSYQTSQAEQVLVRDNGVMSRDRELRHEISVLKELQEETEKKLIQYRKTIKDLNFQLSETQQRADDTTELDAMTLKYVEKTHELSELEASLEAYKIKSAEDKKQMGQLFELVAEYYFTQRRGLKKPMSQSEIESNPDKFIADTLIGAFEENPSRFRKIVRKYFTGETKSTSKSFWAEDDQDDSQPEEVQNETKWWSTNNLAYLGSSTDPDAVTGVSTISFSVKSASVVKGFNKSALPVSVRSIGIQTDLNATKKNNSRNAKSRGIAEMSDEQSVMDSGLQESMSLDSASFMLDAQSAPNLLGAENSLVSSTGGNSYFGMSVDRGLSSGTAGRLNRASRSYDAMNFTKKKKIIKKVILPRLDYLGTPPTPQTDMAIAGHHVSQKIGTAIRKKR